MSVILDKAMQLDTALEMVSEQAKHDQVTFLLACVNLHSRRMVMFQKKRKTTFWKWKKKTGLFGYIITFFFNIGRNLDPNLKSQVRPRSLLPGDFS